MKRAIRGIRILLYWVSVLPPVIDAVRGLVSGIKKGLDDVKNAAQIKDEVMRKRFEEANRGN